MLTPKSDPLFREVISMASSNKKQAVTGLLLVVVPALWNFAQGFFGIHLPFSFDDVIGPILQGGGAGLLAKSEKI